jgi:PAS domain S-box-containing protein
VLAKLPVPILMADDNGRYVFANDAACTLVGRPRDSVLRLSVRDITEDPIDAEAAWREFVTERRGEGTILLNRPSGETVSVEYVAASDFLPGLHISVLRDVSGRERVDGIVRRNEELFGKAFRGSPVPMNIRRLDNGIMIDANDAFTEALGYWRSELIGKTPEAIGLWNDPSKLAAIMDGLQSGSPQFRAKAELRAKNGEIKEMAAAFQRVDVAGECLAIAVYTDISAYS